MGRPDGVESYSIENTVQLGKGDIEAPIAVVQVVEGTEEV